MNDYAQILREEDPRIAALFNVEGETEHGGHLVVEDPFPAMAKLMAQAPVHRGQLGELMGYDPKAGFHFHIPDRLTYTTFSFQATSRVLIENETFSSRIYEEIDSNGQFGHTILQKVGKEHRRLRGPIQPFFTPQMAATWWNDTIIAETVEVLISKIEGKGSANLFLELCARMPVHVVSAGFGIDPEDIVDFRIAITDGATEFADVRERGQQVSQRILDRLIEARRKDPKDDIISKFVAAEIDTDDGGRRPYTNTEIINHVRLILAAGGGTTWRQLGITLMALLNDREQFEALKADRSLVPSAILESVRWHATDLMFPRRAEVDVNLCGVDISAGAMIHMCLGAANRDPTRWENPDKYDMFRPVQRSLGFAGGPHSCLGQHVSRQEMTVALNAVMDRLPNLRWDPSRPRGKIVGSLFARGPDALHVLFD